MTTRLLLVRHGQTAYNAEVRFMGQLDIPLDTIGRAQALAVAQKLKHERPVTIYSSNLSRAKDTAIAIQHAIPTHPKMRIDERLDEGHFGDWQGRTYADLKARDPEMLNDWEAARHTVTPPNAESIADMARRVEEVYKDICAWNEGKNAIIVAHGGTLQVLIAVALGLPLSVYWRLWVANASVSELRIEEWGAVLHLLNDISHLSGLK